MKFITLWTFSQSWALKNLQNLYWANVEVAAKHSVMEVFFGSFFFSSLCGEECLEDINALIGQFKQRSDTLLPGVDTVGRGLNNDFEWSHLLFSFMAENMVFMMVTAMLKNFYLYLVRHISEKVKPLKRTSRLKAFILHFVSVPAKWVRTGRRNVLNLYTNKTYYAEIFIE